MIESHFKLWYERNLSQSIFSIKVKYGLLPLLTTVYD